MRNLLICLVTLFLSCPASAQISDPNAAGIAFGHVHLTVTDRALHSDIWADLFGAVPVEKDGYMAVRIPGSLVFFSEGEPSAPSWHTAMDHFGIKVRDMGAILDKWQARGYEMPRNATSAGRVFLTMPDGIKLELEEDPDLAVTARMDHVHFFASADAGLVAMYVDYFGARQETGKLHSVVEVPGSKLIFNYVEDAKAPTDGTAIDHIGFEVEEWEPLIKMLEYRNVKFEFGPIYIDSLDLWVAFFTDPSGVSVEITNGLDHF